MIRDLQQGKYLEETEPETHADERAHRSLGTRESVEMDKVN